MVKMPKLKAPTLITTRNDGSKEFVGLTANEWGVSLAVIVAFYAVLTGYFIALLTITQTIRGNGNYYHIPGSDQWED